MTEEELDEWVLVPVYMTAKMKIDAMNKLDLALRAGLPEYDIMDGLEMAWSAAIKAAPTPPSQDEPVYQLQDSVLGFWDDISFDEMQKYKKEGEPTRTLYTRPANDKLRQAAEEVVSYFFDKETKPYFPKFISLLNSLRAALEEKQ